MDLKRATNPENDPRNNALLPVTSTLLLDQLSDPANTRLWNDFVTRYHTVVTWFSSGMGLSQDDAADVAQQTILEVIRDYRAGRFDRGKGRLRSWIFGIARHRVLDVKARRKYTPKPGDQELESIADETVVTQEWERAEERALFGEAMERIRADSRISESTVRAFVLFALEGQNVNFVAKECGLSVPQVYVAKHRVMDRVREFIEKLRQDTDEAA